jgi:HSP20 family protein
MEMQKEMNRLFQGMLRPTILESKFWAPSTDMFTRGEDMIIRAELPGVKSEDVDISITDNIMTLKGERKVDKEIKEEEFYSSEICYGAFERSLTIPEGIKVEDIKATYENGILEVLIPKAAAKVPPKKVKVEVKAAA